MSEPLDRLRELDAEATPGPWCRIVVQEQGDVGPTTRIITCESPIDGATEVARGATLEDGRLIVAMRNELSSLLSVYEERLRKEGETK